MKQFSFVGVWSTGTIPVACILFCISPVFAQTQFSEQAAATNCGMTNSPGPNFLPGLALMIAGGAVGDFNRDGFQDIFVIGGGGTTDKLYINTGNGDFIDQAAAWGLTDLHMGAGAAVGDYDNDGWLDLYVTSFGPADQPQANGFHKLYHNNANGTFTDMAVIAGVNTTNTVPDGFSPAFGDFDLDGDLDLFVAGWFTNGTGGNRLFKNDGDGAFTDVTVAAGLLDLSVHGFSPRFIDMNGDRYPELLLAADFETARYYINNTDGTFTDFTVASGTGLDTNGMGHTIGDFNNDGKFDWYVTNIYRGHTNPKSPLGNRLYINQGNHFFQELGAQQGVNNGAWGWGTVAVDIDHDGDQDIVEVNGFFDDDIGPDKYSNQPARVFINLDNNSFVDMALECNFTHTGQGRGLANFDMDNDGDQDLIIFSSSEPLELHRNELVSTNRWVRIFLNTNANPALAPDGFGTHLRVRAGGQMYHRYIDGGNNYLSQSELSAHFGLGVAMTIDDIWIHWADGTVSVICAPSANQTHTFIAPAQTFNEADLNKNGTVDVNDLLSILGAWGQCLAGQCCTTDIDGSGTTDITDLLRVLGNWS